MKTIQKLGLTVIFLFTFSILALSQAPPPPNGGASPGGGNIPLNGGGAPIGSGIGILLALSAGYGSRKVYDVLKKQESLEE
ncbi:MAG: hypothetical protein ACOYN5_03950 [Bacteroidales bacterium]